MRALLYLWEEEEENEEEEEEPGKVNKAASFWEREVDFTVFGKGRRLRT